MQNVSEQFKQAIYAPAVTVRGKVTFDISDTTIEQDIIDTTVSSQYILSDKEQLTDKERENSYNLMTWEPDRFKLDGSFSFAAEVLENNRNVGWVSNNLCNELGEFSPYETLVFEFGFEHSSIGITITFDTYNNEYAKVFTINAYDENNNLIHSEDVIDNNVVQAAIYGQFYLYRKIEIIVKKWSKPYRRARAVEVDFGIVRVYTDNNLNKMDLIEEMDITSSTLSSAEFKFTVFNENREFNILNPQGFYKFLQERQQIIPEIGVDIGGATEYVRLGQFYLMDWVSDEGSQTATFTARNIIDIIANYEYENLLAKVNYNLYDMAVEILEMCGVGSYEIDIALKDIPTLGLVKLTDCRMILQMISIASMSNVYVSKGNKVVIKQSTLVMGEPKDTIDMDAMYTESQIELMPIVKSVQVAYYSNIETKLEVMVNNNVEKGNSIKVDNTLINTEVMATNAGNWLLRQLSYRAKYKANFIGNPAHELNDIVIIEDSYNQNNSAIITKNELTYQGYLEGKTELRGII